MFLFWNSDNLVIFNFSTQVGSQPITSVAWLPTLRVLVTLSKDGSLQMWKARVILNPNRPPTQANFFEPAGSLKCLFSYRGHHTNCFNEIKNLFH